MHYFGPWARRVNGKVVRAEGDGWKAAIDRYLKERDDLYAGRDPKAAQPDGYTVGKMANEFLNAKKAAMERAAISPRHFRDLFNACKGIVEFFGPGRLAEDVSPVDFEKLAYSFPATWALRRRKREIGNVRAVFAYAALQERIARTRFGAFKSPSRDEMETERFAKERKNGNREFKPEQLRKVIDAAPTPLRAMILLAVNAGYGNTDVSELTRDYLDLDAGWATFPRIKTSVSRRAKLWPETIAALRDAAASRPKPRNAGDDLLVFITGHGNRFIRVTMEKNDDGVKVLTDDSVSRNFRELLTKLGVKRHGLSFYSLRHCCETHGGADQVAVDAVMGHRTPGMGTNYRQSIADDRLEAVADAIHAWLYG